jgi:hypothetical protein
MVEERQGTHRFVVMCRKPPEYATELAERFKTRKQADACMRERCGPPDNHYEPKDEFSDGVWYMAKA